MYVFMLSQTDREGRIEADDVAMMTTAGRFAVANGWDLAHVASLRNELRDSGIIIVFGDPGAEFAQIVAFHRENRSDPKELASRIPEPPGYSDAAERKANGRKVLEDSGPSVEPPRGDSRPSVDPARSRPGAGLSKGEGEGEGEAKGNGKPARGSRAPKTATKSDIIRQFSEAYEAVLGKPCSLKPRDPEAAQAAADLGTFPAGVDLVPCFKEAICMLRDNEYTISLKAVVNNAEPNGKPKPSRTPAAEPFYPDLSNLREQMERDAGRRA